MLPKWLFDRIISLLGLLCLGWLYLVIAIMIKFKTDGLVFYAQVRVGRNGRLFRCHKFCTMEGEQEESPIAALEQKRITPIGRTLRHLHLDELPQLWDVFTGNMSFVGPRPDVPGYADKLEGEDRAILRLRPGILRELVLASTCFSSLFCRFYITKLHSLSWLALIGYLGWDLQ